MDVGATKVSDIPIKKFVQIKYYEYWEAERWYIIMQAAGNFVWFLRCHTFWNQAVWGNSNAVQ
jgi:hypothetical protein